MIGLVGTSDSIAKCEKSDVLARMLKDKNTPKFRSRGKKKLLFGGYNVKTAIHIWYH